jgi:NifU-like protein involved in Fe-S cluster formation/Pyruvate/2-oxoacid:ferredoxin oxidoreductase delta subunit
VDAADLHLLLQPEIRSKSDFYSGVQAVIDSGTCTQCGKCRKVCQFDAVTPDFGIDRICCEGCSVCFHFCPAKAISLEKRLCGEWYFSTTRFGPFFHARLGIAEANSGKLVAIIRNQARKKAESLGLNTILIDGSPGTGSHTFSRFGESEQEEAAACMNISCATFGRIVAQGRGKIADALVHGKAIRNRGRGSRISPSHTSVSQRTGPTDGAEDHGDESMQASEDRSFKKLKHYLMGISEESYSDKLLTLAYESLNVGDIENPDGSGRVQGSCGDIMQIFLKLDDNTLSEVKFLTDRCGATIACRSAVIELAKGKTPYEAGKIYPQSVIQYLDGLPASHVHCAVLVAQTLREAIENLKKTTQK